ncbi:MAG: YafY family protein [Pseudomonadota bacterium]
MRRTDRLKHLIARLQAGGTHRAEDLAAVFAVSPRTIYRDMEALIAAGAPVMGTPGVGYCTTAPITLPPLALSRDQLEALHLGLAVVAEGADAELQTAAKELAQKIDALLPEDRGAPGGGWGFALHPFADAANGFAHMPALRAAIRACQKLRLDYRAPGGLRETRVIRPLQIAYWGRVWMLTAWCESVGGFEVFRVDSIAALEQLPELFVDEPGTGLADYLAQQTAQANRTG